MRSHERSREFVLGALAQTDAGRRLTLVERALRADPESPDAHALLGHCTPFVGEAQACYARAEAFGGAAMAGDCQATNLAIAAAELAGLRPHEAVGRMLDACRGPLPDALAPGAFRVLAAAAAACGDWEALAESLRRGGRSLGPEAKWLSWVLAQAIGREPERALDDALAAFPDTVAGLVARGRKTLGNQGNVACIQTTGAAGAMAAEAAVAMALAHSFEAAVALDARMGRYAAA